MKKVVMAVRALNRSYLVHSNHYGGGGGGDDAAGSTPSNGGLAAVESGSERHVRKWFFRFSLHRRRRWRRCIYV